MVLTVTVGLQQCRHMEQAGKGLAHQRQYISFEAGAGVVRYKRSVTIYSLYPNTGRPRPRVFVTV